LIFGNFITGAATEEYGKALNLHENWPMFDYRCFNLPRHEIENYFYWRQKDALRNSINMLAQSKFSHKELNGVSCNQKQEMLFQKFGINWNDLDQEQKTGCMCLKEEVEKKFLKVK
jgi:tRNA(His) guanylyltransferase